MPKSNLTFDSRAYATVAQRITLFYRQYPSGRINTELVARDAHEVTFKALVFRQYHDTIPAATGWASERYDDGDVNSVACLENTETSAVGRALANLGFTASLHRPSREEMQKAERARQRLSLASVTQADGEDPQVTVVHEVVQLLATARRLGFSARRSAIIESHVNHAPGLHLPRMRRLEQRVRIWLRRRGM
jgi:hypothetical protein